MKINKNALKRTLGYFAGGLLVVLGFAAAEENAYRTGVQDGITFMPKLWERFKNRPDDLDVDENGGYAKQETIDEVRDMWVDHIKVFQKNEE